jgi:hypothetical protein
VTGRLYSRRHPTTVPADDHPQQSQVLKALRQVNGEAVGLPFSSTTTALLCGASGLTGCHAALDQALVDTAAALQTANGGSATPSSWTANSETQSGSAALPALDAIHFAAVGIAARRRLRRMAG